MFKLKNTKKKKGSKEMENCNLMIGIIEALQNGKIINTADKNTAKALQIDIIGNDSKSAKLGKKYLANDASSTCSNSQSPTLSAVSKTFQGDYISGKVDNEGNTIELERSAHSVKEEWQGVLNVYDQEVHDIALKNKEANDTKINDFYQQVGKKEIIVNTKIKNEVNNIYEKEFEAHIKEEYDDIIEERFNKINLKQVEADIINDIRSGKIKVSDSIKKDINEMFNDLKIDNSSGVKENTLNYKTFDSLRKDKELINILEETKIKRKTEITENIKKRNLEKINKDVEELSWNKAIKNLGKELYNGFSKYELELHLKKQEFEKLLINKSKKQDTFNNDYHNSNNIHMSFMDLSNLKKDDEIFNDILTINKKYIYDEELKTIRFESNDELKIRKDEIINDLLNEFSQIGGNKVRNLDKFNKYMDFEKLIKNKLVEEDHQTKFYNFQKKSIAKFSLAEINGIKGQGDFDKLVDGLSKQMRAEGLSEKDIVNDLGALEKLFKQHMNTSGIPKNENLFMGTIKNVVFATAVPSIVITSIAELGPLFAKHNTFDIISSISEAMKATSKAGYLKNEGDVSEMLNLFGEYTSYFHKENFKSTAYAGETGNVVNNGSLLFKAHSVSKYLADRSNKAFGLRKFTLFTKALNVAVTQKTLQKAIKDGNLDKINYFKKIGLRNDTIKYIKETNFKSLSDIKDDTIRTNFLDVMKVNSDLDIATNANYTTAYKVLGVKMDDIKSNNTLNPLLFFTGWMEKVHNSIMANGAISGKHGELLLLSIFTSFIMTGIQFSKLEIGAEFNKDKKKELKKFKENFAIHLAGNLTGSSAVGLGSIFSNKAFSLAGYNIQSNKSFRSGDAAGVVGGPIYGKAFDLIGGTGNVVNKIGKGKYSNATKQIANGTFDFLMPSIPVLKQLMKIKIKKELK